MGTIGNRLSRRDGDGEKKVDALLVDVLLDARREGLWYLVLGVPKASGVLWHGRKAHNREKQPLEHVTAAVFPSSIPAA
jgi:hypothetical protein